MTAVQIITEAGRPIQGLGPWRPHEKNRHTRAINALKSIERLAPWSYIVFDGWTRQNCQVFCAHLNNYGRMGLWCALNHPTLGYLAYYKPNLLACQGPDSFEIKVDTYTYPFKQCALIGNWFKVRNKNVKCAITQANRPDRIFLYRNNSRHGHIIYRAL